MSLAPDKSGHIVAGAIIAAAVLLSLGTPAYLGWGVRGLNLMLAVAFVAVVSSAVGKELLDMCDRKRHTPDPWDAIATIAGGLVVILPVLALTMIGASHA